MFKILCDKFEGVGQPLHMLRCEKVIGFLHNNNCLHVSQVKVIIYCLVS